MIALFRRALIGMMLLFAAPLAAQEMPPLEAYGALPSIEDMSLSPDGKKIAVAGLFNGKRKLVLVERGGEYLKSADLGETKLSYVRWIGNERVIALLRTTQNLGFGFTTDKYEAQIGMVISVGNEELAAVFADQREIVSSIFDHHGIRQIGDRWLGYYGGLRLKYSRASSGYVFDHGRPYLFEVDLATNKTRTIAQAAREGHWRDWLVGADGQVAATIEMTIANGRWSISGPSGEELVTGIDPTGDIALIGLGKNGDTVIYITEDDLNESSHVYEVPLTGGSTVEIHPDIGIDRYYRDPKTGWLIGFLQQGAPAKPVLFDPAHQRVFDKIYQAFEGRAVSVIDWTPGFDHILVHTSGNADSGTYYVVDMDKMRAEPVGYERVDILPQHVGKIETVDYTASDGLELDGILTLPPNREPRNLPAILLPHGGPHVHDEERFDWWAQAFASRGYAVFQPNFRGSTNRDRGFIRAGYGQWGRKMQTDISEGLAMLAEKGIVDPSRACIVGGSYGGYAALAGVTLQQGLYRCAVAFAPVSDLKERFRMKQRESGNNKMVKVSMEESLGDPQSFNDISPRRFADRADAPILLIHGKDDTVVDYRQSKEMAEKLEKSEKPHEFITLDGEDHWLSKSATRQQMLEATMRFVTRHNPAD